MAVADTSKAAGALTYQRGIQVFRLTEREQFEKLDDALDLLSEYIEAGGDGLTAEETFCPKFVELKDIFDLFKCDTDVLIRKYCVMEEKGDSACSDSLGTISVSLDYRTFGEQVGGGVLNVDVMDGKGLKALDSNGLSDPYVVVDVNPALSNDFAPLKTKTQKKTLNPFFNEHFSIDFPQHVSIQNFMLAFTVWDHDYFSADDFMGEVFVPLGNHFSKDTSHRMPGLLTLKLKHPNDATKSSDSREKLIYSILERRQTDTQAKDFIRKRMRAITASIDCLKL